MPLPQQHTILLVEDNQIDAEQTIEAFKKAGLSNVITWANSGGKALEFLKHEIPTIILLDLNMPEMDGHEVLAAIRKDKRLKYVPVLVLTSSDEDEDIIKSCCGNANGYIKKPIDVDGFLHAIQRLAEHHTFEIIVKPK